MVLNGLQSCFSLYSSSLYSSTVEHTVVALYSSTVVHTVVALNSSTVVYSRAYTVVHTVVAYTVVHTVVAYTVVQ